MYLFGCGVIRGMLANGVAVCYGQRHQLAINLIIIPETINYPFLPSNKALFILIKIMSK